MGFIHPTYSLLLIVWGLVALLLVQREKLRSVRQKKLGILQSKSHLRALAPLLSLLLLVFAIMRPYSGFSDLSVNASGRDILVVLDVSRSMFAQDVPPSRLELAQRKLRDLLRLITSEAKADRVGIVLFAGDAYSMCPLTQDYAVVQSYIDAIGGDLVGSAGSSIQNALETASNTLKSAKVSNALILLVTDGEDRGLDPASSSKIVRQSESELSILGVGSLIGSKIELPDGTIVRNRQGQVVISKLNQDGLERLASETNGRYSSATLDDQDLLSLTASDSTLKLRNDHVNLIRNYNEFGWLLVLSALLVLLFNIASREFVVFGVCLLLTVDPTSARAQSRKQFEARRSYESGDFNSARSLFEQALNDDTNDLVSIEGLADSLFKLGETESAAKLYQQLIKQSPYPAQKFRGLYNLGNSQLAQSQLKDAIESYTQALNIKKDDAAAIANRELALRLLALTPSPTPTPTPTQVQSSTPSNESTPQSTASAGESNPSTPSPNPSSSQTAQPTPQDDGQTGAAPSPQSDPTAQPSAVPSAESSAATTPTEAQNPQSIPTQALSATELPQNEANSWLDSLDDAPLLVGRRRRAPPSDPEQSW